MLANLQNMYPPWMIIPDNLSFKSEIIDIN